MKQEGFATSKVIKSKLFLRSLTKREQLVGHALTFVMYWWHILIQS